MMITPRTTRMSPCTAVAVVAEEAVMVAVVAQVVAGATVDVAVAAEEDVVVGVAPSLAVARVAAATAAKTVERSWRTCTSGKAGEPNKNRFGF